MQSLKEKKAIPGKLFYKIGEVSEIAGVKPYILRYWESEFPFLKPNKNKSGQRVYTRKNLDLILQVRDFLYQEKYTIAGVKKRFRKQSMKEDFTSAGGIEKIKKRLKEVLDILSRNPSQSSGRGAAW